MSAALGEELPPPRDNVGFNDPGAWGFCEYCAFEVGLADGLRIPHPRVRHGAQWGDTETCFGSGRAPTLEAPETATPQKFVSLRKTAQQIRDARWHRILLEQRRSRRDTEGDCGD